MTINDYAMFDDGEFKNILRLSALPDLPGKPYRKFYPVKYEFGEPFTGLVDGFWVVRNPDPATLPAPVPYSVTPRQARLALLASGWLQMVETAVNSGAPEHKITWEYATEILRSDPLVTFFGDTLGLSSEQIDDLFRAAEAL